MVQGEEFSLLLDNGSHDANYINGKVAEGLGCHLVIGRGDLVRHRMYGIMETLDRAEMGISDGREDEEGDTRRGDETDKEWKSVEAELAAMEKELDGTVPAITDWSRGDAIEDKEFETWVISMRKEMIAMVETEYSDIFATVPPSKPADVWEQKLELIGEPIDTPEGLRKVPGALRGMGRRIPMRYAAEADRQIQEMLAQGVIELSTSAISVPVNLTPKPDSNEMRFCLDCRQVNTLIRRENFPMAGINEFTAWMEFVQPEFFC